MEELKLNTASGFTLVGAPVGMDMDLQTLVPQYSDNMTNSQAQIFLVQPSGQSINDNGQLQSQFQLQQQTSGDFAFLTSDLIDLGQSIQLQLPGGLQLPISMLTASQFLGGQLGIQLLEPSETGGLSQAQIISNETRHDELTNEMLSGEILSSQQDHNEDVVNHATVLLQLAADKTTLPKKHGTPTCDICHSVFDKWCQLNRHMRMHEEDKPFHCNQCSLSFNLEHNLRLHEATHNADSPECPECGKKFSRLAGLKAHILLHEKEETMICGECGDEFNTQMQLERHLSEEHGNNEQDKIYSCRNCTEQFTRLAAWREHVKQNHRVKAPLAQRQYKKRIDRTGFHQRCKHCNKTFQKPSQLERHLRIHTGERPYSCEICSKSFNQKGALLIHMAKHTGDRPFMCEFCPQSFSQKGNLRAHVLRVHADTADDSRKFRCEECSCSFRKLGSLNAHISRVHYGSIINQEDHPQENIAAYEIENRETNDAQSSEKTFLPNSLQNVEVGSDILKQALENSGVAVMATDENGLSREELTDSGVVQGDGGEDTVRNINVIDIENECESNLEHSLSTVNGQSILSSADNIAGTITPESSGRMMMMAVRDGATGMIRRHLLRKVNGIKWHQCSYCGKEFKKPSDLVRHVRIHTRERPFKCRQCYRTFAVKSTLNAHIRMHSGLKEFKCPVCQKLFSTQGSMRVHLRLHTGAKPFSCEHCLKTFRTSGHLKSHMQSHIKEGQNKRIRKTVVAHTASDTQLPEIPLQEPIIITDGGFIQHPPKAVREADLEYEEGNIRPYKCHYCSRGFKKSSHVKQHERSHTGEKPYQCLHCMKKFVSSGVLKAHLRIHSGARNFHCPTCNGAFTTNGSLRRHLTTHTENRPYMCPYCQHTFKTSVNCKKHMRTHRHELALQALQQQQQQHQQQDISLCDTNADSTVDILHSGDILIGNTVQPDDAALTLPSDVGQDLGQSVSQMVLSAHEFLAFGHVVNGLSQESDTMLVSDSQFQSINPQQVFLPSGVSTVVSGSLTDPNGQLSDPALASISQVIYSQSQVDEDLKLAANSMQPVENLTSTNMHNILPSKSNRREQLAPVEQHQLVIKPEIPKARRAARCSICYKSFKKLTYLRQHMRHHHSQMHTFSCDLCKMVFASNAELMSHTKCHTGNKEYTCVVCNTTFATMAALSRHSMMHVSNQTVDCVDCGKEFPSLSALQQHACNSRLIANNTDDSKTDKATRTVGGGKEIVQLTEEQTDLLSGILPDNSLTVSERLLIETAIEKNRTSYVRDRTEFAVHFPTHNNKCSHCPKSFRKPSDLARHMRTHTGERPFSCYECGRAFTVKSTLDSHLKTHQTDERATFFCHMCGSPFSTKGTLKVHMRLHTGAKPFKCPHCDMRFRTSGHRKGHLLQHFKDPSLRNHRTRRSGFASDDKRQPDDPSNQQLQVISDTNSQLLSASDSDLLTSGQNLLPISLTLSDAFGSDVSSSVAQLLEGMQLQIGGQGFQITGIDTSLGTQPIHIDASAFLQHISNTVNLMNPNLLSGVQAVDLLTVSGGMATNGDALNSNDDSVCLQSQDMTDVVLKNDTELTAANTEREEPTGVNDLTDVTEDDEDNGVLEDKLTDNDDAILNDRLQSTQPVAVIHYCPICLQLFLNAEDLKKHVCVTRKIQPVATTTQAVATTSRQVSRSSHAVNIQRQGQEVTAKSGQRSSREPKQMHACEECGKEFGKPSQLVRHFRIHTGERPFVCGFCQKAFNQKNALQIHEKKHTGDRPYKCDVCSLTFCQKGNLHTHLKRVHQYSWDDIQSDNHRGQPMPIGMLSRDGKQVSLLLNRDARLRGDSMTLLTNGEDVCIDDIQVERDDDTQLNLDDDDTELDESFLTS